MITQEQFILASQSLHLQRPGCDAVYPVGLYGWRKRCLYFFLLLLLVTMIVNLALTVWIIKVMNFSVEGMGSLQLKQDGIRLEGISEFLLPLYVNEIQSRRVNCLLRSSQLLKLACSVYSIIMVKTRGANLDVSRSAGPEAVEAQCQRLQLRSQDGSRLLFTANEEEVIMTTEKFTVTGKGAALSLDNLHALNLFVCARFFRLESPTRTLTMEAPRGVEVSAAKGPLKVSSRKDLQLESTEGEILLDAQTIQLGRLPLGVYTESPNQASREQAVYEVCVCPSGKIYLAPAETSSTCQAMSNICLWS
uniref:Sarcoglycan zeta n=1 Tax=Cyclopterus lumpus TaxID=8103 RepID=A0A8C2X2F4_CYCLU